MMKFQVLRVTSRTTIYRALTDVLELSKVSARWVPRQLTDEHKKKSYGSRFGTVDPV